MIPYLSYDEPLFRPPSEAYSLIFQVTLGCSWNRCAFCEMYTSKKFSVKKETDVFKEIEAFREYSSDIRKVFLADGNAFVLSFERLSRILDKLHESFPKLNRVSAYALPKDILSKSDKELKTLSDKGLKLLYVGIESGDDELLPRIHKGETFESSFEALIKARKAGIKLSVMILNGLGGKKYSEQHAINSAKVVNAIQPEYLSTLVLSFPYGMDHFKKRFEGEFKELSKTELILEMGNFINHLQLESTIFRSDHASNYLILKGILNRDKGELLRRISQVLQDPSHANLRPEWMRGL
ncbi:MAG: radical SAM protein [Marinilabiliales bacterium]|nr:MAG: radical SAM protein [Marinilabiliales bacterium]